MYIGDLHIHSRYSRATSRDCTPEHLELWARKKGIGIVGTGDFTHPAWREELKEKLEPAEDGLYVLKEEYRLPDAPSDRPRFVVTGEISSIYKQGERVRKVHSLLILPGLEEAEALARRLELIGNIHSDGRPILGLPCRDLLEIMLETCPSAVYVPAHIWTPHFSLFGAFSGFNTIEECYGDLAPHIRAVETGLSSDPPMNWRVSGLDGMQLISNSDAHSPAKLGREANLLDIELSYAGLAQAILEGKGLAGTIEFFPEEGKYHFDGHRKCGLCLSPRETARYGGKCPVCGRKITIGVENRVEQLADREEGFVLPSGRPFESLVPLPEVIAASTGASAAGKKVAEQYEKLLKALGPEFPILREVPIEEIRHAAGPLIAEGIRRLRAGEVERTPGFDGEYGRIGLLSPEDISSLEGQMSLFTREELRAQERAAADAREEEKREAEEAGRVRAEAAHDVREKREVRGYGEETAAAGAGESLWKVGGNDDGKSGRDGASRAATGRPGEKPSAPELNVRQQEAVEAADRAVAVIAGPGAGKTKTLISRLTYLLEERHISPEEITAVTFTNKAAEEMQTRLNALNGGADSQAGTGGHGNTDGQAETTDPSGIAAFPMAGEPAASARPDYGKVHIGTFHALCSRFLQEKGRKLLLADEGLMQELAEKALKQFELKASPSRFLSGLSRWKNGLEAEKQEKKSEDADTPEVQAYICYQEELRRAGAMDYDDLLLETLQILEGEPEDSEDRKCFTYLLIDEFQDINPLQYRLVQEWNRGGRELFVIGDPDQAIYGFRGSDSGCFLRLAADYPGLKTVRLEENYRSTPEILSGALQLISHNEGGARRMEARRKGALPVRVAVMESERQEAIYVAKEINRQIGGIDMLDVQENGMQEKKSRSFADIAVLYRTHRQAEMLEKCLRQEGIPYIVAGREDFLEAQEVRASLYFFRSLLDRESAAEELAGRLLAPLLGEAAVEKLEYLREKYAKKVKRAKPVKVLEEWCSEIRFSGTPAPEGNAAPCEVSDAMKKLTDMSVLYPSMEEFLHTLSFGEDGDVRRNGGRKYTADAVTLMTLHGSKGLEFPMVFLYGMDQGRLPLEFGKNTSDIQEERRLCFVGMTRAVEELVLVCGKEPSCFLDELPGDTVLWERQKEEEESVQVMQLSLFDFI